MTYDDRMTLFARVGFAARGLVYLLIGRFALDVANNGGHLKDNKGALGTLAGAPLGHALLAICAIGFVGYAVWRLTETITDPKNRSQDRKGRFSRARYAIIGITHLTLTKAAARLALRQTAAQGGMQGNVRPACGHIQRGPMGAARERQISLHHNAHPSCAFRPLSIECNKKAVGLHLGIEIHALMDTMGRHRQAWVGTPRN